MSRLCREDKMTHFSGHYTGANGSAALAMNGRGEEGPAAGVGEHRAGRLIAVVCNYGTVFSHALGQPLHVALLGNTWYVWCDPE